MIRHPIGRVFSCKSKHPLPDRVTDFRSKKGLETVNTRRCRRGTHTHTHARGRRNCASFEREWDREKSDSLPDGLQHDYPAVRSCCWRLKNQISLLVTCSIHTPPSSLSTMSKIRSALWLLGLLTYIAAFDSLVDGGTTAPKQVIAVRLHRLTASVPTAPVILALGKGCLDDAVDCSGHGHCSSGNQTNAQCVCDSGYTNERDGYPQCTYARKKQLVAFILQAIPLTGGLGVADFYVEQNGTGAGKLLLCFFGLIGPCLVACCGACGGLGGGCAAVITYILVVCSLLASLGWWIADIVRYAQNQIHDGSGYGLAPV
jgi:TM2 domain-containing membrane protein YozV